MHPDAKEGVDGNRTLGSLYDLITAENLQTEGRAKQFKGIGQWNQGRLVSNNGHVEHWLNGEKIVQADTSSKLWKSRIAKSKFNQVDGFAQNKTGRIQIQDHGRRRRVISPPL